MSASARKVVDLRPDLNSIDADRMLIGQTAAYVGNLWKQMNSAEMYIAAGREFSNLHENLAKNNQHDKERIGWKRAFSPNENKLGCSRRTAENYILVFQAFFQGGNVLPPWKLPQSFRALVTLAKLRLPADQLSKLSAEGSLRPNSTEADIKRLAEKLNQSQRKPAARKAMPALPKKSAPKPERVQAALQVLARLGLTPADLAEGA